MHPLPWGVASLGELSVVRRFFVAERGVRVVLGFVFLRGRSGRGLFGFYVSQHRGARVVGRRTERARRHHLAPSGVSNFERMKGETAESGMPSLMKTVSSSLCSLLMSFTSVGKDPSSSRFLRISSGW